MGFANEIIAVSESVKRHIILKQRIGPKKVSVIHNGIDVDKYTGDGNSKEAKKNFGLHNDPVVVGVVGRLDKQKGIAFFLRAASEVLKVEKHVQFLIVGEGPQRQELEKLSRKLGISGYVVFLGFIEDVPQIMSLIDIFVLPSLWEGLPISLLEAMAARKPVIATGVGGIPEVLADEVSGLLVPPKDTKALTKAILELLKDTAKREAMGEKARQRVAESFNIERMVRDYEECYLHYVGEGALIS